MSRLFDRYYWVAQRPSIRCISITHESWPLARSSLEPLFPFLLTFSDLLHAEIKAYQALSLSLSPSHTKPVFNQPLTIRHSHIKLDFAAADAAAVAAAAAAGGG